MVVDIAGQFSTLNSHLPRSPQGQKLSFSWRFVLCAQHIHTLPNTCLCNKDNIPLLYFILIFILICKLSQIHLHKKCICVSDTRVMVYLAQT